jgi:DNA-binding NarL/FixJ family response regulator
MEVKEPQIIEDLRIKNLMLEKEIVLRNAELASIASALVQKEELLKYLREKLEQVNFVNPDSDQIILDLVKSIDADLNTSDNWTEFQLHFDKVHDNFLLRFKERHKRLNQSWLLMCAYIRMNKSVKEISNLLNISIAAVEKRRYRLKEKLGLDRSDNLVDYINHF